MKVALFAPNIAPNYGGVWQFILWVMREVGTECDLSLVSPTALFDEVIANQSGADKAPHGIRSEAFRAQVCDRLQYRLLDRQGALAMSPRVPKLVKSTANLIRRKVYGKSVAAAWMLDELASIGTDVAHIPLQFVPCRSLGRQMPYVINPHDYQHEHFPENFPRSQLASRRRIWYEAQRGAAAIVVHSRQTYTDALHYLRVPEERVFYAPYGPLRTFPDPDEATLAHTRKQFALPDRFIFYPARAWPHKNHETLIDAAALLKAKGVHVHIVFTDMDTPYGKQVCAKAADLGLSDQVIATGRASSEEMSALFSLCTMVAVPSLFEQNSGPMLEAIQLGKAVVVSNLPELVASLDNEQLVFDGRSPSEMAQVIDTLWSSDEQRAAVEQRLRLRRDEMSWKPFQDTYRRAYAFAAG